VSSVERSKAQLNTTSNVGVAQGPDLPANADFQVFHFTPCSRHVTKNPETFQISKVQPSFPQSRFHMYQGRTAGPWLAAALANWPVSCGSKGTGI